MQNIGKWLYQKSTLLFQENNENWIVVEKIYKKNKKYKRVERNMLDFEHWKQVAPAEEVLER